MASEEFVFTAVYFILAICLLVTPTEFRSAGLTVENILSSWLGMEDMKFIEFQIKRTAVTVLIHSALPLVYYIGIGLVSPRLNLFVPWGLSLPWMIVLCLSVCCFALGISLFLLWRTKHWDRHPIARSLSYHGNSWRSVAASVNTEFRRIDKFQSGPAGRRTYVTDSWIIKTSPYSVKLAQQHDCHLNILHTEEHPISHESPTGAQFVTLNVISLNKNIPDFEIRLNSIDYKDLKDKVSSPVVNARNVVIQQSIEERFLVAFRHQVDVNPSYSLPEGSPAPENCISCPHVPSSVEKIKRCGNRAPENCIGCLHVPSNVKLIRRCDLEGTDDCVQCYCRPMWCCDCMCKWFASRQNQTQPETWMSGKSPCPTCRSVFCMLDISHIES